MKDDFVLVLYGTGNTFMFGRKSGKFYSIIDKLKNFKKYCRRKAVLIFL